MTQPIAGWYTDPAGDTTKLRYWDGTKWTDSLMDAPAPQPEATSASAETQAAAPTSQTPSTPVSEAQTVVSQDTYAPIYVNYADAPLYYVSPQDTTLRLVAFILALISTITMGFAVIPLAWMIPMTVMTWQIYKGKRANTVGFDVCSLIFLNLVSGILLLVSTKDQ